MTSLITQLNFVDLYLGDGYTDIKGLAGSQTIRSPAPAHIIPETEHIRELCFKTYAEQEESEFSIIFDNVMYRVTQMVDVMNKDVFILRRSSAEIRPYKQIGLSPKVLEFALGKDTRGLILVVGEMAAGKSSTAASLFSARLFAHGGIGLAIEDPPETKLNGEHGIGRCIQVRASRKNGGYREQLIRAVRSGADSILIGEIRDEDTAYQAAQAGINGHLIYSTLHAGSIRQAIERILTLLKSKAANANDLLAAGLAGIVHQRLEHVPRQGGEGGFSTRLISESLIFSQEVEQSARSKIREGKVHQLQQEIDEQRQRNIWTPNR